MRFAGTARGRESAFRWVIALSHVPLCVAKCKKGTKCASRRPRGVVRVRFDGLLLFAMFRSAWRSAKRGRNALRGGTDYGAVSVRNISSMGFRTDSGQFSVRNISPTGFRTDSGAVSVRNISSAGFGTDSGAIPVRNISSAGFRTDFGAVSVRNISSAPTSAWRGAKWGPNALRGHGAVTRGSKRIG